jgi:hypothetical protein
VYVEEGEDNCLVVQVSMFPSALVESFFLCSILFGIFADFDMGALFNC